MAKTAEEGWKRKPGSFIQSAPRLGNQWTGDTYIQEILSRYCPDHVFREIAPDLNAFGERVVRDVMEYSDDAQVSKPILQHYDNYGRRVDRVLLSKGWRALHDVAAEEGLVSIAHERKHGCYSRLHWATKNYLFAGSSGLYNCPLAMTDGAARVLEMLVRPAAGEDISFANDPQLESVRQHLLSRDPSKFWTSGQWMTERAGGSDVSRATGTVALEVNAPEHGPYISHTLHGVKWFASAVDGDIALALARKAEPDSVGPDGETIQGTRDERVTLFLVHLRDPHTKALQNMEIMKLKDKLGTQQLPSAELMLRGTPARQLSGRGKGVAAIAEMLNVTRMWNAVTSVGTIRRAVALAMDYSTRRRAFGRRLIDLPLHVETLCAMEVELRGNRQFMLQVASLLGKRECGEASDTDNALLRLLTPIMKAYTAKHVVRVCSEVIEAIGGQAYTEDSGVPLLLRDAQVLPVWEGTTNIMSLDVLRVLAKNRGDALSKFISHGRRVLQRCNKPFLASACKLLSQQLDTLAEYGRDLLSQMSEDPLGAQACARGFLFALAHCNVTTLLLEHAHFTAKQTDVDTLVRYMESKGAPLCAPLSSIRQRTLVSRSIIDADTFISTPNTYRPYGPSFRALL